MGSAPRLGEARAGRWVEVSAGVLVLPVKLMCGKKVKEEKIGLAIFFP